jgi:hypothetical protein
MPGIAVSHYVLCLEEPSEGFVAVVNEFNILSSDPLGRIDDCHDAVLDGCVVFDIISVVVISLGAMAIAMLRCLSLSG